MQILVNIFKYPEVHVHFFLLLICFSLYRYRKITNKYEMIPFFSRLQILYRNC